MDHALHISPDAPPPPSRWRQRRLALAVIGLFLALQTIAGLKLLAPSKRLPQLAPLRLAPNPTLWPFLAYDMYSDHWKEGRAISRPSVVGLDATGARHTLTPESVGLSFREFRDQWLNPLRGGATAKALPLARRWSERGGVALMELRCEDVPAIVVRDGVADGERIIGPRYPLTESSGEAGQ
ncbi:MAG: hypothetical protein EXS13_07435 [Planctomycetes bacterium]|nr:hypothetical protein [Planctomycetota bacterium]